MQDGLTVCVISFTMYGTETLLCKYVSQCTAQKHCLTTLVAMAGVVCLRGIFMIERGLYYANADFTTLIKSVGGEWNDTKHRPIVCLIKSTENEHLF